MATVKNLSASSVGKYLNCPRSWMFRYVEKVKTPTSPHLVFGTAFHNTIEEYIKKPADERDPLPDLWKAHWETALSKQSDINWGEETPEGMFNTGSRMFRSTSVNKILGDISPMIDKDGKPLIEKFFEMYIPGVGVPFVGYVDIILSDGTPADFKTSAKAWYKSAAQKKLQPLFYIAGLRKNGYEVDGRFKFLVFTKGKAEGIVYPITCTDQQVSFSLEIVRSVWGGIKANVFPPCDPGGNFLCSKDYCEYWDMCGHGRSNE